MKNTKRFYITPPVGSYGTRIFILADAGNAPEKEFLSEKSIWGGCDKIHELPSGKWMGWEFSTSSVANVIMRLKQEGYLLMSPEFVEGQNSV